jgi:ATPase family protein associated with various cellular activities (AAA)
MSSFDDWTGKLAAPRRNRYFTGKMLRTADLELEQRYGMHQRWLMNRVALGAGVLCGLQLTRSGDGKRLEVAPGVAVDGLGREIVVPEAQTCELRPGTSLPGGAPSAPGRYQICLSYQEYDTEPVPIPGGGAEAGTRVESFALELRVAPPAKPRALACDARLSRLDLAPPSGAVVDREPLAARVAALLEQPCPEPAADAAVALGVVVIGGAAGALAFEDVHADGRMRVFSNAELMEMVLCLAERLARSGPGEARGDEPPAHDLGGAAQRIDPRASWHDLALPDGERAKLRDLVARVRAARALDAERAFGTGSFALFRGERGTGRRAAAEVLARELGIDLFRIDLSAVSSRYIGETEKNLDLIFAAAEKSAAILFFDEADALFGKRAEVKDADGRSANLETSWLLQRLEAYRGLSILAVNPHAAIDPAFLRRFAVVVSFPPRD